MAPIAEACLAQAARQPIQLPRHASSHFFFLNLCFVVHRRPRHRQDEARHAEGESEENARAFAAFGVNNISAVLPLREEDEAHGGRAVKCLVSGWRRTASRLTWCRSGR